MFCVVVQPKNEGENEKREREKKKKEGAFSRQQLHDEVSLIKSKKKPCLLPYLVETCVSQMSTDEYRCHTCTNKTFHDFDLLCYHLKEHSK